MRSDDVVVIGVDPGKLTGIATFWGGEFRGTHEVPAAKVGTWIEDYCEVMSRDPRPIERPYFLFAVERYQIGGDTVKKTRQPDAMLVTGMVQSAAGRFHGMMTQQNASDAKKIGKPSALSQVPGYVKVTDHRLDASSQVYMALARWYPDVIDRFVPRDTI